MSQSPVWWRVLVLSCIAMFIAYSVKASGQNKGNSGFAIVDFRKITTEYKGKDAIEGDIRAMQNKFLQRLARREQLVFLTEQEHAELDTLSEKASQSDADKAKIKELGEKSRKRQEELQTLSQKKQEELTDADKKKLEQGNKDVRDAQERYAKLKENLDTEFSNFSNTQSDQFEGKIRAAIAKVAEQKGVALVFNSNVALYAGTDITQAVIGELNKK